MLRETEEKDAPCCGSGRAAEAAEARRRAEAEAAAAWHRLAHDHAVYVYTRWRGSRHTWHDGDGARSVIEWLGGADVCVCVAVMVVSTFVLQRVRVVRTISPHRRNAWTQTEIEPAVQSEAAPARRREAEPPRAVEQRTVRAQLMATYRRKRQQPKFDLVARDVDGGWSD